MDNMPPETSTNLIHTKDEITRFVYGLLPKGEPWDEIHDILVQDISFTEDSQITTLCRFLLDELYEKYSETFGIAHIETLIIYVEAYNYYLSKMF